MKKNEEMKIEYVSIELLNHYENNSKIHTKEQIEHIANSIKKFGFNDPLGIAGDENTILEGNGRVEAARLLGMTELPCVRLDHLSPEERSAYVIVHNAVNLETGLDEVMVIKEAEKLEKSIQFKDFGIDAENYKVKAESYITKELKPYKKVHYLVSFDVNRHDEFVKILEQIKKIEGVEIESSQN